MTTWTSDELDRIATADELRIAPLRGNGTPRTPVPIWVVRDGDDLYVRSYRGRGGAWFRAARANGEGRIRAGGVDKDVAFVEEAEPGVNDRIDAAYRTKYGHYSATYVDPMVAPDARATTLRLMPR
ncbi:DUF2255 family protein [Actinoallomurus acanthiterrae]